MNDKLNELLYLGNATLVVADIADYCDSLHPAELDLITGMRESRAYEFCTGRLCAHQALHTCGIDNFPILKGEQREPLWPRQVVGSISHCRDLAGAVVADKQVVKSIGLDIESRKLLNPAIARHICTEEEKAWVASQAPDKQNHTLLLIFSIKEAIFKCIYQATGEHLRFQQFEALPQFSDGIADVAIDLPGLILQPGELIVRFYVTDTHVYSGALWSYLPLTLQSR